jgi:DNA invertase Pin-like site-specific DNA recombinase
MFTMTEASHAIAPRHGDHLEILLLARSSSRESRRRKEQLKEQVDRLLNFIGELYSGPTNTHIVPTESSGGRLIHPALAELVRSRKYDLLVVEDLSRLGRSAVVQKFCRLSSDHGVRIIAADGSFDTNDQPGMCEMMPG